ncbi:hypothetical protein Dalk_4550 [Desulfatibacillum aliphaticivorans]|uniref:LamG domain protein jellyroll fold domain protein n=1 Tax=Desulfatibacillum aliphaticivorans TaxID=218208 RepID=B8FCR5_DESAL|nr:LamG domain-containing protein [Desulfatibacillum aliphaticivorans]ACL06228.1 hypothetical protein Dalk_4550 [Desulfatibacillum aliphaticivorans]
MKIRYFIIAFALLCLGIAGAAQQGQPLSHGQVVNKTFGFNGAFRPGDDPLAIGIDGYTRLENMRYNDVGLEGVAGYTKVNSTALLNSLDLEKFTEDDDFSKISVDSSTLISISNPQHATPVYLYAPYSGGFFEGSTEYQIDVKSTSGGGYGTINFWGISEFVGGSRNNYRAAITSELSGTVIFGIYAESNNSAVYNMETSGSYSEDAYYTCRIRYEDEHPDYNDFTGDPQHVYGVVYMDIYAENDLSEPLETIYAYDLFNFSEESRPYLIAFQEDAVSGHASFDGYIRNFSTCGEVTNGIQLVDASDTCFIAQVGQGNSRLYRNNTAIPESGDFTSTVLWYGADDGLDGRFCPTPDNGIAYCNGAECCIWHGDEMPVAGFWTLNQIVQDGAALTFTASTDTIKDGSINWFDAGFRPGQRIEVGGTSSNNKTFTIESITSDGGTNNVLNILENLVTDEGAGAGTATLTACVSTGGYENPLIYSVAVNNKLSSNGNVAPIGLSTADDSSCKTFLEFEGSDGSTTFTDSSSASQSYTATGNAKISTASSRYGTGSLKLDGNGDYISMIDTDDVDFDSGRFTIDGWFKLSKVNYVGYNHSLFSQYQDSSNYMRLYYTQNTDRFRLEIAGAGISIVAYIYEELNYNQWYHIALIRGWGGDDDAWAMTIDGVAVYVVSNSADYPNLSADFVVGANNGSNTFSGNIDDFRITKGKALWTSTFSPQANSVSTTNNSWLVMTRRPIQGVKYYVSEPNSTASTTAGWVWNGSSMEALEITDGTASGGVSLAQTGSMTFDSTVDVARPLWFEGYLCYAYLFNITSGSSANIYRVTVDAPFQKIKDIWDGLYRQCVGFQVYDASVGSYTDYVLHVNQDSYEGYEIGAEIGGFGASDYAIVIFEERMTAFHMKATPEGANSAACPLTVYYHGETGWQPVSSLNDGTIPDDATTWQTLGTSGLVTWTPPDISKEIPQALFDIPGYAYKIVWSETIDATATLDHITGIPAQVEIGAFKFPFIYKNKLFLANNVGSGEGQRIDYCTDNAPDSWNGITSSYDGLQSIYIPGTGDLTGAASLYNRYGSNFYTTEVLFTESGVYQLSGSTPEDFQVFPVSEDVGCPAPLTIAAVDAGASDSESLKRKVIVWLSASGPKVFDGATIVGIPGVDNYFDPDDDDCINFDFISTARGWYDRTHKEYNLTFPSGDGQTSNNAWLVYDFSRNKWFEKVPTTYPTAAFTVQDASGTPYVYAGTADGYVLRLENGTTWDGTAINQVVETGDFDLTGGDLWFLSALDKVKLFSKDITETANVTVTHYSNTSATGSSLGAWSLNTGTDRITRDTQNENKTPCWTHRLKFETSTSETEKGWQPLGFGLQTRFVREDTQ